MTVFRTVFFKFFYSFFELRNSLVYFQFLDLHFLYKSLICLCKLDSADFKELKYMRRPVVKLIIHSLQREFQRHIECLKNDVFLLSNIDIFLKIPYRSCCLLHKINSRRDLINTCTVFSSSIFHFLKVTVEQADISSYIISELLNN